MKNINRFIDHTILKINTTEKDVKKALEEALKYNFKALVVYPKHLCLITKSLQNKETLPVTVIDFPGGDGSPDTKAKEAKNAIKLGAKEIDMVLDVMALKDKNYKLVFDGIKAVVDISEKNPVKVILETCYLNNLEIAIACSIAKLAGAKFVKTSTGFAKAGANPQDIILMKTVVGNDMEVKASGGIKNLSQALLMLDAGATRIGSSSSVQIMEEAK